MDMKERAIFPAAYYEELIMRGATSDSRLFLLYSGREMI